jgi:acyl-CoA reductase-like NAD-dependent aldehyde dehydrogenase
VIVGRQLIDGHWRAGPDIDTVANPFDGERVGTVVEGSVEDVAEACAAAKASLASVFPVHSRYDVLMAAAGRINDRAAELAHVIASEGSKTIREAEREPPRAAEILRLSAEESRRAGGEVLPFDMKPGSERRRGYWERRPAGVVAAIQPFNDPMAVAAHKIGPALAAGNAVVLKPDSRTPFSVLALADALVQSGLPAGRLNVVTGSGSVVGQALVRDPRIRVVSFTGGRSTGEAITRSAGIKRLVLELGSTSAVIVMDSADLDAAAHAIVAGAFAQAGQNCLGVQRVLIQEAVYAPVRERIVRRSLALKTGHSLAPDTDVCAMISEEEAARVRSWIGEAVSGGATTLCGGGGSGAVVPPTVLEGVPPGCNLDCGEVYGPVLCLSPVGSLEEAIGEANRPDFGLHAAIFTASLDEALEAADRLEAGAVIVNDSTDYRLDTMPFGGVKGSGLGREGIRFAVESMTEPRVVSFNR